MKKYKLWIRYFESFGESGDKSVDYYKFEAMFDSMDDIEWYVKRKYGPGVFYYIEHCNKKLKNCYS